MAVSPLRYVALSLLLSAFLNAASAPTITTTQLPPATTGIFYSASLAATGGTIPYSWSVTTGQLPAGLTLNPAIGTISGTPTNGNSSPTIGVISPPPLVFQVTDTAGLSNTADLPISVADPVVITTTSIAPGMVGTSYFFCMAAQGGLLAEAGSWSIVSGALPAGLAFAPSLNCAGVAQYHNPAISGTPTQAGSFPLTLQASDSQGRRAQQSYIIVITPLGTPAQSLILAPSNLSFTAQASGQAPPAQTVLVELSSGPSLGFSTAVTQGASWLSVGPPASTTPANLTVSVNPAALSPGPYNGTIEIVAPGSPNSPQFLSVVLETNVTSSTANGVYGPGSTISIQVSFIGPVTVTGAPQLALNSGGTANYISGSGTATLNFSYTVGGSDSSSHLDYASTGALTLNGGAMNANLTLAAPGAAGSLGANSNMVIGPAPPAPFFSGEVSLGSGVYYLQFPDGNLFGYYTFVGASILFHYDLGYEAFIPGSAADGYLYDFVTTHWFYTSSALFPYLYDFTLNSWIYYFPSPANPGHYTTNPRYFSNLTTGRIFTM